MGTKRNCHQNPQPFLPADEDSVPSRKKRSKVAVHHQEEEKEIEERNPINNEFSVAKEEDNKHEVEEKDVYEFTGFFETQRYFEDDIDEDDEELQGAFFSMDQRTVADIVIKKIIYVSSEEPLLSELDKSLIDLCKEAGQYLSEYTAGEIPEAFKVVEDVLYSTEPESLSPNAMYQATRMFASNFCTENTKRFYRLFLLPRVRDDIRKNKGLHFALYQALEMALYKPAAFNQEILFPLCKSGTCNLREAVIVGSIIQKGCIPMLHSSVALLKLAEMEHSGTRSYFIKLLLEKKYALPYRVLDAVFSHFMRFLKEKRTMPVIWHQTLLAFVQRYKNELWKEDKDNLVALVEKQKHYLVTPEIIRELGNSRNRRVDLM